MQKSWVNDSVLGLAGEEDPINVLSNKIKQRIYEAIENGYTGPPFDPITLAKYLGIEVLPSMGVDEARVVQHMGSFRIEYNPTKPQNRIKFSIAHEIAHTFFPDCGEYIRNRSVNKQISSYDWELELLCNLGAAEILMPKGSFVGLKDTLITINNVLQLRKQYNVSTEAVLRRIVQLTEQQCFIFSASSQSDCQPTYKLDYYIPSKSNNISLKKNFVLPKSSVIYDCTAIGYSEVRNEIWEKSIPEFHIECVGLPPYPGSITPRVVGIGYPIDENTSCRFLHLNYTTGNVLAPNGNENKIIAHIVNDEAIRWGGKGVAKSVATKWPHAYNDFNRYRNENFGFFSLGNARLFELEPQLFLFSMIAQNGYGPSEKPRIRYNALEKCLYDLGDEATRLNATIHMPKIGTGYAKGDWNLICELIDQTLLQRGIETTVYLLPR